MGIRFCLLPSDYHLLLPCPRQESNLDFELRTLAWFSVPPRGRRPSLPSPGFEPGTRRSKRRMMSVSLQGLFFSRYSLPGSRYRSHVPGRTRTSTPELEAPNDFPFHHGDSSFTSRSRKRKSKRVAYLRGPAAQRKAPNTLPGFGA